VQVSVNQQELVEYIVASAQQYGMDPNAFAKAVDEAGQVPAMVAEVARRKALASVLEKAHVTDAAGNEVDLSALFADTDEGALDSESGDEPQQFVAPIGAPAANDPTALPTIAVADFEPDDAKA
jgi:trigger factor